MNLYPFLIYNQKRHNTIYVDNSNRTDPTFISLVEGYVKNCPPDTDSFYGKYKVNVVEIPDDVQYEIDEPEGCNEIIREKHRVWGINGLIE